MPALEYNEKPLTEETLSAFRRAERSLNDAMEALAAITAEPSAGPAYVYSISEVADVCERVAMACRYAGKVVDGINTATARIE